MLAALFAAVLVAQPAAAVATPAAAQAKAPAQKQKMVCRDEIVTGSNMRKRVCVPQATRDARRDKDQHVMREHLRHPDIPLVTEGRGPQGRSN